MYDSVSYFGFLENVRSTCFAVLRGTVSASPDAIRFSVIMTVLWCLTCILLAWYAVFQITTILLAAFSLTPHAASPLLNRLKRLYRIFVPARGIFVFLTILPALVSGLPWLFTVLYKTVLGQSATLYYDLLPDIIPLGVLSVLNAGLFLATLRDQRDLKLDLFRIYRIEK